MKSGWPPTPFVKKFHKIPFFFKWWLPLSSNVNEKGNRVGCVSFVNHNWNIKILESPQKLDLCLNLCIFHLHGKYTYCLLRGIPSKTKVEITVSNWMFVATQWLPSLISTLGEEVEQMKKYKTGERKNNSSKTRTNIL